MVGRVRCRRRWCLRSEPSWRWSCLRSIQTSPLAPPPPPLPVDRAPTGHSRATIQSRATLRRPGRRRPTLSPSHRLARRRLPIEDPFSPYPQPSLHFTTVPSRRWKRSANSTVSFTNPPPPLSHSQTASSTPFPDVSFLLCSPRFYLPFSLRPGCDVRQDVQHLQRVQRHGRLCS